LVSILVAFVLAPVTDFLSRFRLPRAVAALISVLLLVGLIGLVAYLALNPASSEKGTVKVRETPDWTDLLSRGFGSISQVVLAASFIPFLVFFMLTWQEHARRATMGLFAVENRRAAYKTLGLISGMIRNFMVGNLMIGLIMSVVSTIVFGILHISFFYFAGFISGFLSLIPYLGVALALLPPFFLGIGHLTLAKAITI